MRPTQNPNQLYPNAIKLNPINPNVNQVGHLILDTFAYGKPITQTDLPETQFVVLCR
ncbi:hypothetical protein Hanom_Chr12g01070881 [Helianthus anomalus]